MSQPQNVRQWCAAGSAMNGQRRRARKPTPANTAKKKRNTDSGVIICGLHVMAVDEA